MSGSDWLLPCPFCGRAITEDEGLCKWNKDEFGDTVDEVVYTGVCCPGCSAFVPINAHDKAEAIAAWNRRVAVGVWPDFIAPAKYENPAPGWTDPKLPDFRAIWQVARTLGYSVGLHGSMKRDCDLIAVPWVDGHSTPQALIDELCKALNAREVGDREAKPNGRVAVNLQIDGYYRLIDLSIVGAA